MHKFFNEDFDRFKSTKKEELLYRKVVELQDARNYYFDCRD